MNNGSITFHCVALFYHRPLTVNYITCDVKNFFSDGETETHLDLTSDVKFRDIVLPRHSFDTVVCVLVLRVLP